MSKYSGDTARAHRIRKARCNKRAEMRVLRAAIAARKAASGAEKPKA